MPQRLSSLPNVPTFAELDYPKLTQVVWIGLWVAFGTSHDVSAQLRKSAIAIVQSPAFRKKIAEIGMDPPLGVPMEEMAAQLSESSRRHAQKLKEIGNVPDQGGLDCLGTSLWGKAGHPSQWWFRHRLTIAIELR
ncbi:tripartite tricarboxylate transporter substrate-binding protein [Cupriavidus oxalaticus]|uniref:tripartite tricarboxylate transporter substrate-binding protein n=1 Tax=Cupriavidus oxalaticus TaxID=96344 RepID=UPI003D16E69A